jgi:hypothetical protein
MKRIALSVGLSLLALVVGVAAPRAASAHGGGGGHGGGHAGGWHGGGSFHASAAPAFHGGAGGGWRGGVANVNVHSGARPGYGYRGHPGWGYGYGGSPAVGHWGWQGPTRVWFGVATVAAYPGWSWAPGHWVWDGYRWVWQEGYWAPPY